MYLCIQINETEMRKDNGNRNITEIRFQNNHTFSVPSCKHHIPDLRLRYPWSYCRIYRYLCSLKAVYHNAHNTFLCLLLWICVSFCMDMVSISIVRSNRQIIAWTAFCVVWNTEWRLKDCGVRTKNASECKNCFLKID